MIIDGREVARSMDLGLPVSTAVKYESEIELLWTMAWDFDAAAAS
jgi:hypothetical protein